MRLSINSKNELKESMEQKSLDERIEVLDQRILELEESENFEFQENQNFQSVLGIRLALAMAKEIQSQIEIGTDSASLVLKWSEKYGKDNLEFTIQIAKDFLTSPTDLKDFLAKKLF